MLTKRAIVALGCTGGEWASADRSVRRIPERHLCGGIHWFPFPAGAAVIRAPWNDLRRLPSVLPGGPCGAMGAMGADERLFRLVPRRPAELFEIAHDLKSCYGIEP